MHHMIKEHYLLIIIYASSRSGCVQLLKVTVDGVVWVTTFDAAGDQNV